MDTLGITLSREQIYPPTSPASRTRPPGVPVIYRKPSPARGAQAPDRRGLCLDRIHLNGCVQALQVGGLEPAAARSDSRVRPCPSRSATAVPDNHASPQNAVTNNDHAQVHGIGPVLHRIVAL
jgi:hypothetical protein